VGERGKRGSIREWKRDERKRGDKVRLEERGQRESGRERGQSEGDFFIVSKQFFKIIAICRRQI